MTSIPTSGAAPSAPGGTSAGGDAQTVAALQAMLAAMTATLTQGSAPPGAGAPASAVVPAPVASPVPVVAAPAPFFHTGGPWIVGNMYVVVPAGPLLPIAEVDDGSTPLWYCITKGKFVGVTVSNALALAAVTGVSSSSMKSHKSQASAVAAFNDMLHARLVIVIA